MNLSFAPVTCNTVSLGYDRGNVSRDGHLQLNRCNLIPTSWPFAKIISLFQFYFTKAFATLCVFMVMQIKLVVAVQCSVSDPDYNTVLDQKMNS